MKDDMEIISSIYKTLSNEKEQYANKDKHFINLNMPGVQPEHSIATIKRNTKHIKNNIDDNVKNYDINRENYENKEKFINLYHNCKNEDLYGSHHNNNSFLERNYEKSLEKFKKISPEFNEEVNYEKLPKKTIQSQKIEEKENISIPDKRNSRNSFILEKSDNEEKNSPKKRFSYNRMKIERDRFSRNDLERDISRILKDEYVNELLVESTIIHKEKQKPDIKENQFYKNLFTEIVDDKFSCGITFF